MTGGGMGGGRKTPHERGNPNISITIISNVHCICNFKKILLVHRESFIQTIAFLKQITEPF